MRSTIRRTTSPPTSWSTSPACRLEEVGRDRVRVAGIGGKPRTSTLKVSISCAEGFIGEDMFFYAGPGALRRAQLAKRILEERFKIVGLQADEVRIDFVGMNAIHGAATPADWPEPYEIAVRVAARTRTRAGGRQGGTRGRRHGRVRHRPHRQACAAPGADAGGDRRVVLARSARTHPAAHHLRGELSMRVKLQHVAHARSGDKGNTANIAVIAYAPELYPVLKEQLTAERREGLLPGRDHRRRGALRHRPPVGAQLRRARRARRWRIAQSVPRQLRQGALGADPRVRAGRAGRSTSLFSKAWWTRRGEVRTGTSTETSRRPCCPAIGTEACRALPESSPG